MSNFSYIRDAMGYKERATWIDLLVAAGVSIWYLTVIVGRMQVMPVADVQFQGPMIRAAVISVVVTILLNIVVGILTGSKDTKEDLRDRQVGRFGDWVGLWPLAAGAGFGLVLALLEVDHFWIANTLYVGFVASSLVGSAGRLLGYRRGVGTA